VGTVKAQVCDVKDIILKDIILASLQSVSMKTYVPEVFSDIGLLIVDEVHRNGTEVFSRALHKLNTQFSLGLSATVQRKDGMSKVFTWFLNDVVYAIQPHADQVDVIMHTYHDDNEKYREEPVIGFGGKLDLSRMINNITYFAARTELIAHVIVGVLSVETGRCMLVLSDRKKHLADIGHAIERHPCCPGSVSVGMYIGGMKPAALAEPQGRTVILATYSFASEGFDVPGLDTLVMASPKTDIEQSVGQLLRKKADQRVHVPLIIDIHDRFSVFEGQAKRRKAYYRKRGYRLRTVCL
jgi:hypothetical protein